MNDSLRQKLVDIAKKSIPTEDPSHDISHTLRVLSNADNIAGKEGSDLDIVVPAALFHDLVTYPKSDPRNKNSVKESAEKAGEILNGIAEYPKEKIAKVKRCILCASFSYGEKPETLEEKTVVDADLLEATGAISIMRTFASSGKMVRPFYEVDDPFATNREVNDMSYALDLFYTRLLKVEEKVWTNTAKKIAKRRTKFLHQFLNEFKKELSGE